MITFAAFYIELTQQTMAGVHQHTPTVTVTKPYWFMATMFASATFHHSNCRRVVLTDQQTLFPAALDCEPIRFDLDPSRPMLARSTAWREFIGQADSHIVFLDSDMLINASLDHLFTQSFDVALTYRDDAKWPINAGINFVHGNRLAGGRAFHTLWLDHFQQAHDQATIWGGDQDALRDLLNEADFSRHHDFIHTQHGFDILLLPCADYNFSTADQHGMTGHYPQTKVLHFKGRRKPNMIPYWERYLEDEGEKG
ncbi:MAG: hypothetical protein AAF702_48675 [Chloroflexota bacterium]